MHRLNTPSTELPDVPTLGQEGSCFLTAHAFVFHEGKTLLLHDKRANKHMSVRWQQRS